MDLINILIRTSGRPGYYKHCIESIKKQTYKNYRIIVGADGDYDYMTGVDVVRYKKVRRDHSLKIDKIRHFPYNLYLNKLMDHVNEGYVMFLDDDDELRRDDSLEKIAQHIRDALFWRVKIGDRIIPSGDMRVHPVCKDISGIGFAFHSKYIPLVQWDAFKQCDYRVASRLYDIAPGVDWLNLVLTGAQGCNNEGQPLDKGSKFMFVCPIWGRPKITKIWATNIRSFPDSKVLAILSPEDTYYEDNLKIVRDAKLEVCYYKNRSLGEKLNAGINYALDNYNFEYMVNIGSDDLIHPRILDLYQGALNDRLPYFGLDQVFFINSKTKEIRISRQDCWGAGRFIRRDIINSISNNGGLYDDRERGLDTYSMHRIQEFTAHPYQVYMAGGFPYVIDIKDKYNLNDFELIRAFSDLVSSEVLNAYSENIKDMIYELK